MPYTVDQFGRGPAWSNSLFEDNAEYGLGMVVANRQIRDRLIDAAEILAAAELGSVSDAASAWLTDRDNAEVTREVSEAFAAAASATSTDELADDAADAIRVILADQDNLVKRSIWAIGGDGWAYDIGFGGLDHVIASGENINILVLDTEVYSNTGGQSSKATPQAAIAKFAASGKRIKKKDLGAIAMSYGYVYVAQVGMGASMTQLIKAVTEAEAYDGPSIVIAYAPCIHHGSRKGMGRSQESIKDAVNCGYWQLYRYNPLLAADGKNPFSLDSKEPTENFREFIMGQTRYSALAASFPEAAETLLAGVEADALERYASYRKLTEQ
jgi:pyruvate-ferredoxin/flavodoxin oxidoreductase